MTDSALSIRAPQVTAPKTVLL